MKTYKMLNIPDRTLRTVDNIDEKQTKYCDKSSCTGLLNCMSCLFARGNVEIFIEWYLAKNKKGGSYEQDI